MSDDQPTLTGAAGGVPKRPISSHHENGLDEIERLAKCIQTNNDDAYTQQAARRIRRLLLEARINTLKPYAEQFQSRTRQNQDQGGFEFYWGTKLLTEYKKLQHELQQLTDGGQE